MLYQLGTAVVVLIHFTFVLFAACGALLVLKWPRLSWLHLPALAWAIFIELSGRICPLTPLEVTLRQQAGLAGYSESFIEHYIVGILYPEQLTRGMQVGFGLGLLLFNAALYALLVIRLRNKLY